MIKLADYLLELAHLSLIFFNLFGWIFKKTRRANLWTLILTFLSWFGLGLIFGIGYCPLTDWHWQVKEALGVEGLPNSYIQYLITLLFGPVMSDQSVDYLTFGLFFLALGISIWVNYATRCAGQKQTRKF